MAWNQNSDILETIRRIIFFQKSFSQYQFQKTQYQSKHPVILLCYFIDYQQKALLFGQKRPWPMHSGPKYGYILHKKKCILVLWIPFSITQKVA